MTRRAFAVAAHPDDIEFVLAGTLIRLRDAGYELHSMNLANGAVFHQCSVNDPEILYDRPTLARQINQDLRDNDRQAH